MLQSGICLLADDDIYDQRLLDLYLQTHILLQIEVLPIELLVKKEWWVIIFI